MNPCTEIRGDEKVRLRPDHQYDEFSNGYDDYGDDVDDDKHGGGYHHDIIMGILMIDDDEGHSPVRLLLNAWFVP